MWLTWTVTVNKTAQSKTILPTECKLLDLEVRGVWRGTFLTPQQQPFLRRETLLTGGKRMSDMLSGESNTRYLPDFRNGEPENDSPYQTED